MRARPILVLCLVAGNSASAQFAPPRFICGKTMDDPTEVHAADFDGDGHTDLLCLAPNDIFDIDHELCWFRNEGNGEFEYLRPIVDPQARPQAADVGDIDGDGDMEIMVGHDFSNTFGWFANDGAGNFGALQLVYTGSDYPTSVHLVDLDGNGSLDLLASLRFAGADDVFWMPNDGSGDFGPASNLWNSIGSTLSVQPGDLDGDGDMDLVWASPGALQRRLNLGNGMFEPLYSLSTTQNRTGLALGDLDADDDLDVAVTHADSTLRIHWNNGDGSFDIVPLEIDLGGAATSVARTNTDSDDDDDLAIALGDRRQCILRSNGNGSFAPLQTISTRHAPANFLLEGDPDDDGDPDLLAVFKPDDRMGWFANDGAGNYGTDPQLVLEHLRFCTKVQCADVDQDGALDIVASSAQWDEISWFRNDGTSNFSPVRDLHRGVVDPGGFLAVDDDDDGDKDLVVISAATDSIYRLNCDGPSAFAPPTSISTTHSSPFDEHITDVDMDGQEDVLLVYYAGNSGRIAWFEGNGNGDYTGHSFLAQNVWPEDPRTSDLDGDGDQDIVRRSSGPVLQWHANDGTNEFPGPPITVVNNTFGVHAFELGDLDGDDDPDIFAGIVNGGLQQLIWMSNDGFGNFFDWNTIVFDMPEPDIVALRDIDADGDLDLFALSSEEESVFVIPNHGDGTFGDTLRLADDPFLVLDGIDFSDLDNDGDEDIVIHSYDNGMIAWVENQVSIPLGARPPLGAPSGPHIAPNPMRTHATIEAQVEIVSLRLFNGTGRLIDERSIRPSRTVRIERDDLVPGLHIVRVVLADGSETCIRMVVE